MTHRTFVAIVAAACAAVLGVVGPLTWAWATTTFDDVPPSNPHYANINAIAAAGITLGCNPPANNNYCPGDAVTRQQMGSFLAGGLGLGSNMPVANARSQEAGYCAIAAAHPGSFDLGPCRT